MASSFKEDHGNDSAGLKYRPDYVCHYCQKSFISLYYLKGHIKMKHFKNFVHVKPSLIETNVTVGETERIDSASPLADQLNLKIINNNPICPYCNKYYSSIYKLRNHIKLRHNEYFHKLPPLKRVQRNDFPCDYCIKSFCSLYKLRAHISLHHVEHVDQLPPLKRMRRSVVSCSLCEKGFSADSKLKNHMKRKHLDQYMQLAPLKRRLNAKFSCSFCDKYFSMSSSLQRHERLIHGLNTLSAPRIQYKCPLCPFSCCGHIKLIYSHFKNKHDIVVTINHLEFDNSEDFENWKDNLEKTTASLFVRSNINRKTHVTYLKCHRSGHFLSRGKGIRRLKSQGSNKINGFCPASILVKNNLEKITVRFVETHVGHDLDLKFLSLKKEDREYYASKIVANISFDDILSDIHNNSNETLVERRNMITKKDLRNISRCIEVSEIKEKMGNFAKEDVLFYKPRRSIIPDHPEFEQNDFALIVMSSMQIQFLKSFSYFICIDRTLGISKHQFEILSVLTFKQDNGIETVCPCAFYITTKSTTSTLITFFKHMKNATGEELKPTILMTDVDNECYSAWVQVMGAPLNHLFCPWLVDLNWSENLTKIKGRHNMIRAYKMLRHLLVTSEETSFKELLSSTVQDLNSDINTSDFGSYFEQLFANNYKLWASYRLNVGCDVLFNLERVHNLMKYVQTKGLYGSNLGTALNLLNCFIEDQIFYGCRSSSSKQVFSNVRLSNKFHKKVPQEYLLISMFQINNTWQVPSFKANNFKYYCVKENNLICDCNNVVCNECQVCPHSYICTCTDSFLKLNVCDHVHMANTYMKSPNILDSLPLINNTNELESFYEYEVVILDGDVNCSPESDVDLKLNLNESTVEVSSTDQKEIILEFNLADDDTDLRISDERKQEMLIKPS